jgi:flavin reductase (DIM6/NTAB) family NADH-FMN oxidoreductase RutF
MKKIEIKELNISPVELWDSDWLLLSCGDYPAGDFNAMTVAWGSIGNMWNIPIAMIVVRPTRYTYEYLERFDNFTLCGFDSSFRKALNLLGTKSGRNGDKMGESGLTPTSAHMVSSPVYEEANLALECRKLYWHDFDSGKFLDDRIAMSYPEENYHRMYFGEILRINGDEQFHKNA